LKSGSPTLISALVVSVFLFLLFLDESAMSNEGARRNVNGGFLFVDTKVGCSGLSAGAAGICQ
jgi:hypothetical protein